MDCAYCVAMELICLNALLIFVMGILSLASEFFMDGMFVVVLAPMTTRGPTFHPLVVMMLMSCWYFIVFFYQGFQ